MLKEWFYFSHVVQDFTFRYTQDTGMSTFHHPKLSGLLSVCVCVRETLST